MLKQRKPPKYSLDCGIILEHIKDGSRTMEWESENGKITLVQDLDYNHLKNIIAKFKRDGYKWAIDDSVQECLQTELIYRDLINIQKNEGTNRQLREQTTTGSGNRYALSV